MSFINSFFEKKFEHAQSLFFDVRFLFFGFTLISSLGFLIIYSFLYGYYFSGEEIFHNSNFNIVSNLVPFSIQTLTVTSIFFICSYYIISASIPLIRKNKEKKGAIVILFVLIIFLLNLAITMFFANEITFNSVLSFSLIWLFILGIICYLYTIIIAGEYPVIMIKGVMFQFVLLPLFAKILSVMKVLEENRFLELSTILFIPSLFMTMIIFRYCHKTFSHWHNKKWFHFISKLPLSIIISILVWLNLVGNKVLSFSKITTLILMLLTVYIVIVITVMLAKILVEMLKSLVKLVKEKRNKTKKAENDNSENRIEEIEAEKPEQIKEKSAEKKGVTYKVIFLFYSILSNKADSVSKLGIGLILLFSFVLLPRISLLSGQSIRMINQAYEKPIEIIYVNQSGKESNLIGNYYIENNSTLYISNRHWDLEVIKPVNYHIKPIDKEDKQN
ncbi:hypothetical protein [Bacillus mycoides]|uniref:hypothetical protein n=1 Tax=Bacillus mycoides TaxID=1405 RepID=UPI001C026E5C|nr:hypothetical protein [Bacillus mycoides]MED1381965.1 hypothetical protein [Bacillus mycoides]QWH77053.1 hypothetical protein EXW59_10360 [Bacillus mycoides]QWI42102.1 hypothetical protein EXW55_03620 [Bacillus mycoides]